MTVRFALVVVALVCFILGAAPAANGRINFESLGLAFLVLAYLIG